MKTHHQKFAAILFILFLFTISTSTYAQVVARQGIVTNYDEETNMSETFVSSIQLPNNKKSFSMGAYFRFEGKSLINQPCCLTILFASIGKKAFDYEKNHDVSFWAGQNKLEFKKTQWQEAIEATAFVLAGIAYPEEIFVGMKTDEFLKIARAKKVKVRVGKFEFTLTSAQLRGLGLLADRIESVTKKTPNL